MTEGTAQSQLAVLLQLQEHDSKVDQLTHRRDHLPAHQAMKEIEAEAAVLRPALLIATERHNEQAARQASLEAEVAATEHRVAEINARLYGSATLSPKDAQAMSEEVKHLEQRRRSLEDDELVVMELVEPLKAELDGLEDQAKSLGLRLREASAEVSSSQASIDTELSETRREREAIAASVPAELLTTYERLRIKLGGVAVAPLHGTTCGGCHLTLPATDLDRIRRASDDEVVHCEECGRILVR